MKLNFLGMALILFMIQACSNQRISEDKVPSVVLNAVKEKFPGANKVEWKKKDQLYEAEFQLNDSTDISLLINATGITEMKKQDLPMSAMPGPILQTINSQYKEYTIDDIEMLEKNGMMFYQVELEGPGKDLNLVFSANGKEDKTIAYWD